MVIDNNSNRALEPVEKNIAKYATKLKGNFTHTCVRGGGGNPSLEKILGPVVGMRAVVGVCRGAGGASTPAAPRPASGCGGRPDAIRTQLIPRPSTCSLALVPYTRTRTTTSQRTVSAFAWSLEVGANREITVSL